MIFQITETFYKAVEKALARFWGLKLNLEAGVNIVKFLDYATRLQEQDDITEAAIKAWKSVLPKRTKLFDFDSNPVIRDSLINYEILDPLNSTTMEELIASGNFSDAQKLMKKLINIDREYYELIVFQQGKAAILQRIDRLQKDIKNDSTDEKQSFRNVFGREMVLKGYHDYKKRMSFLLLFISPLIVFVKMLKLNMLLFLLILILKMCYNCWQQLKIEIW